MTHLLRLLEQALQEVNPDCDVWYSSDTNVSWAALMKAVRLARARSENTPEDIA